jgi:hypothetical protein
MSRVFYLTAEVAIPAGGSVMLKADMIKQGSYDFYGARTGNESTTGYGMMTRLGSNLALRDTSAGLRGADRIEIVRQNFGFDPENGVLTVALNTDVPHYFIEVRGVAQGG